MDDGSCDWADDGRDHGEHMFTVTYDRPSCGDIDWMRLCAMCFLERVDPQLLTVRSRRRGQDHEFDLSDPEDDWLPIWDRETNSYIKMDDAVRKAKEAAA